MGLDKDDIKALIAILQKGLVDDEDSEEDVVETKPKTKNLRSKKSKAKGKRLNKFDQMQEASMHKEDLEFDRKVKKPPPSARNRDFDYLKVQCRICGKKEEVAPGLVESIERYKCNKCSTGAG